MNNTQVSYSDTVDSSIFPIGKGIYILKNISTDGAIAVEDKNGKYQKAVYIKQFI